MAMATEMYCDGCGEIRHYNGCVGKILMVRLARKDGWSIGKWDLCPSCKNQKHRLKREGWIH